MRGPCFVCNIKTEAQAAESHEIIKMAESCGMVIAVPAVGGLSAIWHGVSTLALEFFWHKAKESERELLMQIFTDQENQPTQFGTVTIDYAQEQVNCLKAQQVAVPASDLELSRLYHASSDSFDFARKLEAHHKIGVQS